jgi:predicted NBD/HSP70 family sugar kinase
MLVHMQDDDVAGGDLTRMDVLAFLGRQGPASRATVARELDLSPATVSQVTRRLIHQGVVEPLYFAPSEGGRPGQLLGLVGDAGRAVGAKVAADHVVLVDVRLDGQVMATHAEEFDATAESAVDKLLALLSSFLQRGESRLLGVGVCVPGVVGRPDIGDVDAEVLGWAGMPLGGHLRKGLGVPVLVENDVKALAVAERIFGRGRGRPNLVVLTVGRGVGFASVCNDALQRGSDGGAGEIAHVVVSPNGRECACGQRGCLEAYIGTEALADAGRTSGVLKSGDGLDQLRASADRGEPRAREVFARAAQRLAQAVAPVLAALNPDAVLVSGEGVASWQYWDTSFRNTLAHRLPHWMRHLPIEVDDWDDTSWARGAAALVLATPFDRNAAAGEQRPQVLARLHSSSNKRH